MKYETAELSVKIYRQKIVNIVRRLQDSGEIIVARGGGDDIIV